MVEESTQSYDMVHDEVEEYACPGFLHCGRNEGVLHGGPRRRVGSIALVEMSQAVKLSLLGVVVTTIGIYVVLSRTYNGDRKAILEAIKSSSQGLGPWAIPVFVVVHTLAIALCFPYAVLFEAAASFLFGFVHGVACIFSAKILGAAVAFWLGRILFRSSDFISNYVRRNKYFNLINHGVARDGWKFVLLARFSPVPSYIINYGLAATDINFLVDFLLPTLVGGLPMIIQNACIGSLTSAATQAGDTTKNAGLLSYLLPALGLVSGLLITWRIKKYASQGFNSEPEVQGNSGTENKQQQHHGTDGPVSKHTSRGDVHRRARNTN